MITPRSLINIYDIRYIDYQNDLFLINLLRLNHGKNDMLHAANILRTLTFSTFVNFQKYKNDS